MLTYTRKGFVLGKLVRVSWCDLSVTSLAFFFFFLFCHRSLPTACAVYVVCFSHVVCMCVRVWVCVAQVTLVAMIAMYLFNMAFLPRIRKSSVRLVAGWTIQFLFFLVSLFVPTSKVWVSPLLWAIGLAVHQVLCRALLREKREARVVTAGVGQLGDC